MIEYLIPSIVGALGFVLGRRTTIVKWLRPSAETSAAWQQAATDKANADTSAAWQSKRDS